jgi:hypothetical protein
MGKAAFHQSRGGCATMPENLLFLRDFQPSLRDLTRSFTLTQHWRAGLF